MKTYPDVQAVEWKRDDFGYIAVVHSMGLVYGCRLPKGGCGKLTDEDIHAMWKYSSDDFALYEEVTGRFI